MTQEERRKRPEHHVVHDYANLVSSGLLITEKESNDRLFGLAPVNSHVWHVFYMNCRKMYEFFTYQRSHKGYLTAQQFVIRGITFRFQHWTNDVQVFTNTHMLNVGGGRLTNTKESKGVDDKDYLAEFQGLWVHMLRNLKDQHKDVFRDEIQHRLDFPGEFKHCGTLGKEFLL